MTVDTSVLKPRIWIYLIFYTDVYRPGNFEYINQTTSNKIGIFVRISTVGRRADCAGQIQLTEELPPLGQTNGGLAPCPMSTCKFLKKDGIIKENSEQNRKLYICCTVWAVWAEQVTLDSIFERKKIIFKDKMYRNIFIAQIWVGMKNWNFSILLSRLFSCSLRNLWKRP